MIMFHDSDVQIPTIDIYNSMFDMVDVFVLQSLITTYARSDDLLKHFKFKSIIYYWFERNLTP